jgi:hypothetical protein
LGGLNVKCQSLKVATRKVQGVQPRVAGAVVRHNFFLRARAWHELQLMLIRNYVCLPTLQMF